MVELRKDYVLDRWVIISEKRASRPKEFTAGGISEQGVCYFCPGNEGTTPDEIGRLGAADKWKVRWFENKFPAVSPEGEPGLIKEKKYLVHSPAYGHHEVIVETPEHGRQLASLSVDEIKDVLAVYAVRVKEISKDKNIKYVDVFKNSGKEAGTSLVHTHTQIIAYSRIPTLVQEEMDASIKNGKCKYCEVVKLESASERKIFESKNFVSFAPFASRFAYEAWIFPKRHVKSITGIRENELPELAEMLKKILMKLQTLNAPYNFFLHYAPKGCDLHFHIEIVPRINTWGGFEISSGDIINVVSPESAAQFYITKDLSF